MGTLLLLVIFGVMFLAGAVALLLDWLEMRRYYRESQEQIRNSR